MREHADDDRLRATALAYVDRLVQRSGGPVFYRDLVTFEFDGRSVPLIHRPKGINTVRGYDTALTILTTFKARPEDQPYEDAEGIDGYLRYKWRGTESEQHDNVALRRALERGKPLIWFFGVASGVYTAVYPVWLVAEADQHQFVAAVTEDMRDQWPSQSVSHPVDLALRRHVRTHSRSSAPPSAGVSREGSSRLRVKMHALQAAAP